LVQARVDWQRLLAGQPMKTGVTELTRLARARARTTGRAVMDPMYETMLWYLAYIHKLGTRAGGAQLISSGTDQGHPIRRRLARWCGHAALRVGTWLLAEELRTEVEHAAESPQPTAVFRT
jgi:hypothetical protein